MSPVITSQIRIQHELSSSSQFRDMRMGAESEVSMRHHHFLMCFIDNTQSVYVSEWNGKVSINKGTDFSHSCLQFSPPPLRRQRKVFVPENLSENQNFLYKFSSVSFHCRLFQPPEKWEMITEHVQPFVCVSNWHTACLRDMGGKAAAAAVASLKFQFFQDFLPQIRSKKKQRENYPKIQISKFISLHFSKFRLRDLPTYFQLTLKKPEKKSALLLVVGGVSWRIKYANEWNVEWWLQGKEIQTPR